MDGRRMNCTTSGFRRLDRGIESRVPQELRHRGRNRRHGRERADPGHAEARRSSGDGFGSTGR